MIPIRSVSAGVMRGSSNAAGNQDAASMQLDIHLSRKWERVHILIYHRKFHPCVRKRYYRHWTSLRDRQKFIFAPQTVLIGRARFPLEAFRNLYFLRALTLPADFRQSRCHRWDFILFNNYLAEEALEMKRRSHIVKFPFTLLVLRLCKSNVDVKYLWRLILIQSCNPNNWDL